MGSYGLLKKPGDFAFVSATKLETYLGHKNYLHLKDLSEFTDTCWFNQFGENCYNNIELDRFLLKLGYGCPTAYIFGDCQFTSNVYDFVHNYLRMKIGEPLVMPDNTENIQAKKLLIGLAKQVIAISKKTSSKETADFARSLLENLNEDDGDDREYRSNLNDVPPDEGFGIGIIQVGVNLGKE